ncbi:MAG: HNH/ENDO VII family nuclease [Nocardioides sp.]|uniref:HNH/ENDO VII family nuclease n=1 Tax=Nocardioides sp. TaxID=35761 RepID=UPI0039E4F557
MSALKKYADDVIEAFKDGFRRLGDGTSAKVTHTRTQLDDAVQSLRKLDADQATKVGKGLPARGTPNTRGYDAEGNLMPYANNRPSYSKTQVEDVWRQSAGDGDSVWVPDKNGDLVEITWKPGESRVGKWDMGHRTGEEYRDLRDDYLNHRITKEEFLREYRKPENYEVQHPGRNRSHVDEAGR